MNLSSICIPYITKFVDSKLKFILLYKQSGYRFTLILPIFGLFLYGIPGYLLVPRKIRWIAMIYSCLLSRTIVNISENTNSSWPDDVYMGHEKQQHFPYGTYIEWKIRHLEIFFTACIESCKLWRTYAYQIPLFTYKLVCQCAPVCVAWGIIYVYVHVREQNWKGGTYFSMQL